VLTKRKRTMILRRLADEPGLSDRALAREFGIDNKTVAAIRKGLWHEEIPHPKPARARPKAPVANATTPEMIEDANPPAAEPAQVLRDIANDPKAPATARVQAAKALLAMQKPTAEEKAAAAEDKTMKRALELVASGGRRLDQ
jgi:hypothetical protein